MRRTARTHWNMFAMFDNDPDDPPGGGGGGTRADRDAALTAFRAKFNNDLERAVATLFDENYRLRTKNRKLTEQVETAKLPDGAVVLTKEQAEHWEAYQKLGAPDALVKKEELEQANARIAQLDARARHDTAAKVLGWKSSVLHDLAEAKGLHIEVKDEKEGDKVVPRVYTRPKADEKAPLVLLEKHVTDALADYLPALKERPAGPVIPPMSPAGGGATNGEGGIVDDFLAKRNKAAAEAPNPFAAATTK